MNSQPCVPTVERFGELRTPEAPVLPTYEEAFSAVRSGGRATELEIFIFCYEPSHDPDDEVEYDVDLWRASLAAVLAEARK